MDNLEASLSSSASLDRLPDEIAHAVLLYLDSAALVKVERVNRRFNSLVQQPSLWRRLCSIEHRFWHEDHRMKQRLAEPILNTDWRDLLIRRKQLETGSIAPAFEASLASSTGRVARRDSIVTAGYDAKDYLLKQLDVDEDADDYLARCFWAKTALAQIECYVAIKELIKLRSGQNIPLERALACIDLCILHRAPMTLDDVSDHIDRIADAFKARRPDWETLLPRELASTLCRYLQNGAFFGIRCEHHHANLQNNLITVALLEYDHPSLPFVSCTIYSAVARRLGLAASPSNFPRRVLVLVSAPPDIDLDGNPVAAATPRPHQDARFHAYMDPLSPEPFLAMSKLEAILRECHIPRASHAECLSPASPTQMVLRAVNNIQYSHEVTQAEHSTLLEQPTTQHLAPGAPPVAPVEVGPTAPINTINLVRLLLAPDIPYAASLPGVLQKANQDMYLGRAAVTDLLLPVLHASPDDPHADDVKARVLAWLEQLHAHDARPPTPTRRGEGDAAAADPRHTVGTYFRHRRWDYVGVVTGWDRGCAAPEAWMRQNGVDALPGGRAQAFYNVVDQAGGARYVAEENVEALGRGAHAWRGGETVARVVPHRGVLRAAGQWCRRWDASRERFVSNVRDAYPDD